MHLQMLGELLRGRGLLPHDQVEPWIEAVAADRERLVEHLQGHVEISDADLWDCLAHDLAPTYPLVHLTIQQHDASVLSLIPARDAWEHLVLPLREEDGELVCATTMETLAQALRYLLSNLTQPFRLVFSEICLLEQFIAERYQYEGVDLAD